MSGSRRRFLATLGAGSGLLVLGAAVGGRQWMRKRSVAGKTLEIAVTARENGAHLTATGRALGTRVQLQVLAESPDHGEDALLAAYQRLEQAENVLSLYRPESQVCRLNRAGRLADPDPMLVEVLQAAQRYASASDGAFDVTVQPLWELYRQRFGAGQRPTDAEIARVLKRVDYRRVEVDSREIRLRGPGTQITLNGIAQGYAADVVRESLRAAGIQHALLDTGELAALGGRTLGDAEWRVGIQHPREAGAYQAIAGLRGRALATSGDYATNFSADRGDHHIFDARCGRSPAHYQSVSVVADTAMDADALSTALFVLPAPRAAQLAADCRAEALLVDLDGRVTCSAGFPLARG